MRRLLLVAVIVSCVIHHHVQLYLGPDASHVSNGFLCKDPVDPTQYLFARAYVPGQGGATGSLQFQLVVDVIDLGGEFPSCLAEDIRASCADETGPCKLLQSVAPTRVCEMVNVPFDPAIDRDPAALLTAYFRDHFSTVITDATDRPVIIRAVATLEGCDAIRQPAPTNPNAWAHLESDNPSSPTARNIVLGCAYSCPVVLDQVGTSISLGIDLGIGLAIPNDVCIATIDACAMFPAPSS